MGGYILRRLLALVPVLLIVSIIIFMMAWMTPGDPAQLILGADADPEDLARLRADMGLDRPLPLQYLAWVGNLLQGDLGESIFLGKSVARAIFDNFGPTVQLSFMALCIALLISIPLGTLAAKKRNSPLDHAVMMISLIGMAVPSFVLGLVLIVVIAVELQWLPVAGYVSPAESLLGSLRYMILPAVSLGTIIAALLIRTTRAAVLDVMASDYIDAARARGVTEGRLLFVHTLRNAGLPILTMIGLTFGALITGSVVTETIFNIPGIGSLIVNAIARRDYPVLQGVVLFITLLYLLVNLGVDLMYGLIDPRIRLGAKNEG